jgi:hypothetical protein
MSIIPEILTTQCSAYAERTVKPIAALASFAYRLVDITSIANFLCRGPRVSPRRFLVTVARDDEESLYS